MNLTETAYLVGVAAGLLVGWLFAWSHYRKKLRGRHRKQVQISGPGSTNIQAGGDVTDTLIDMAHPRYDDQP